MCIFLENTCLTTLTCSSCSRLVRGGQRMKIENPSPGTRRNTGGRTVMQQHRKGPKTTQVKFKVFYYDDFWDFLQDSIYSFVSRVYTSACCRQRRCGKLEVHGVQNMCNSIEDWRLQYCITKFNLFIFYDTIFPYTSCKMYVFWILALSKCLE